MLDSHTPWLSVLSKGRNSLEPTNLHGRVPGGRSGGLFPERGHFQSPSPAGSAACCQQTSGAERVCADALPSSPGWHGVGPAWPPGLLPDQSPRRQVQVCSDTACASFSEARPAVKLHILQPWSATRSHAPKSGSPRGPVTARVGQKYNHSASLSS